MFRVFLTGLIGVGGFVLMSGMASAEDTSFKPTGLYGGAGLTFAFENFDLDGAESVGLVIDNSLGGNLKLGYHYSARFDLELDLLYMDGFDLSLSDTGDVGGFNLDGLDFGSNVSGYVGSLNLKGYLTERSGKVRVLQLYGLAGVGYADLTAAAKVFGVTSESSERDMMLRAGGGVEYLLTSRVNLFAEVSYYLGIGDLDEIRFLPATVGAMLHF